MSLQTWLRSRRSQACRATQARAAQPRLESLESRLNPAPFTFLQPGFTQQLYGVSPSFLGGVAFAPDGDPWADNCSFNGSPLHRWDAQSTITVNGTVIHPRTQVSSNAGCGLTNHPDGSMYTNTDGGVRNLNVNTGAVIRGPFGAGGNALGITPDPRTGNLVYTSSNNGPIRFVNRDFTQQGVFSTATQGAFVDGIYFDPTGEFLFTATRTGGFRMSIIRRDGTLVRHVPMPAEPDGIAFHGTGRFVVTNNINGTMTRFDFPGGDLTQAPTVSTFASGGFRGDLSQVGTDGCLYLTQDRARYDNGTVTSENALVRICGGFTPPPGVGNLGGFKWNDRDGDGAWDAGEPGAGGWVIFLDRDNDGVLDQGETNVTTADSGRYSFGQLAPGSYRVCEVLQANWRRTYPGAPGCHNVTLAAGQSVEGRPGFAEVPNFGNQYQLAAIESAWVWTDLNGDGIWNGSDYGTPGLTVDLMQGGSIIRSATTMAEDPGTPLNDWGMWQMRDIAPGTYQLRVRSNLDWRTTFPGGNGMHTITLTAGQIINANPLTSQVPNFGVVALPFVVGSVWNDADADGVWDGGEQPIPFVQVNIRRGGTLVGAAFSYPNLPETPGDETGYYGFYELTPGTYTLEVVPYEGLRRTYPGGAGTHTTTLDYFEFEVGPRGQAVSPNFGVTDRPPPFNPDGPQPRPLGATDAVAILQSVEPTPDGFILDDLAVSEPFSALLAPQAPLGETEAAPDMEALPGLVDAALVEAPFQLPEAVLVEMFAEELFG